MLSDCSQRVSCHHLRTVPLLSCPGSMHNFFLLCFCDLAIMKNNIFLLLLNCHVSHSDESAHPYCLECYSLSQSFFLLKCTVVWLWCGYLEVAYGLLQWAVVVQHHAPELEWLDMVLVQHEGFLEALHRWFKVTQLSWKRKKRHQHRNSRNAVSQEEENSKVWIPIPWIQILCLSME